MAPFRSPRSGCIATQNAAGCSRRTVSRHRMPPGSPRIAALDSRDSRRPRTGLLQPGCARGSGLLRRERACPGIGIAPFVNRVAPTGAAAPEGRDRSASLRHGTGISSPANRVGCPNREPVSATPATRPQPRGSAREPGLCRPRTGSARQPASATRPQPHGPGPSPVSAREPGPPANRPQPRGSAREPGPPANRPQPRGPSPVSAREPGPPTNRPTHEPALSHMAPPAPTPPASATRSYPGSADGAAARYGQRPRRPKNRT